MAVKRLRWLRRLAASVHRGCRIDNLFNREIERLRLRAANGRLSHSDFENADLLAHLRQLSDRRRSWSGLALLLGAMTAVLGLSLFLRRSTSVEIELTTTRLDFRLSRAAVLFSDLDLATLNVDATGGMKVHDTITGRELLSVAARDVQLGSEAGSCRVTLHGISVPQDSAVEIESQDDVLEIVLTTAHLNVDGALGAGCRAKFGDGEQQIQSSAATFTLRADERFQFRARARASSLDLTPRLAVSRVRLSGEKAGQRFSPLLTAKISYDTLPKKEQPVREGDWLYLEPKGDGNLRRIRIGPARIEALFHGHVTEFVGGSNELRNFLPTWFESLQDDVKLGLLVLYIALVLWKRRDVPSASDLGG